jgi:hypothetical protein
LLELAKIPRVFPTGAGRTIDALRRYENMQYFSEFYQIEVRDEIAKEFANSRGEVDDMMAGLHEVRLRRAERKYDLDELLKEVEKV